MVRLFLAHFLARIVVFLIRLNEPTPGMGWRSDRKLLVVAFLRTRGLPARLVPLVLVLVAMVVTMLAALLVFFLHLLAVLALFLWLGGE